MRYLVDTHLAIWSVANSGKLSAKASEIMNNQRARFFFSAASVWEIAIKRSKHPEDIPLEAGEARNLFLEAGYRELPVSARHSVAVETLPPLHSDPFDRMLVAQAQTEKMTLLTHDHVIPQYGSFVLQV